MPRIITSSVVAVCFALLASTAQTATASFIDGIVAISIQGAGNIGGAAGVSTLGYSFTTSQPFTIVALGAYDGGGTSIAAQGGSELVNLFDVAGSHTTPLIQANVLATDPGTPLSGGDEYIDGVITVDTFRFHSITPFVLPAGSYQLMESPGASDGNISFRYNASGTVYAGITYGINRYDQSGPPAGFGNQPFGGALGDLGPNFLIAPEPSSAALLGLALAGMARRRSSRTRRAS